jgi:methylated-DNA-[protein]-cysteine S-methyltransferase
MEEFWLEMNSPVGKLLLFASASALTRIDSHTDEHTCPAGQPNVNDILRRAEAQLTEYFSGKRENFDLPLAPIGTEFQQRVWKAMQKIPFGQTLSYGQLAAAAGSPAAFRAVGAACGRNPLMIVIPCHRVVGSTGLLTGFAGGIPMKEWLLQHEGSLVWSRLGL